MVAAYYGTLKKKSCTNIFQEHNGDVMSIAINKKNSNIFVSAGIDMTAKVWDIRTSDRSVINFNAHAKDINCVQWFVDNDAFLTGSDDGTVRMFDTKCFRQLNEYVDEKNISIHGPELASASSVDVSKTGSYIFSSYDNGNVFMWNTLTGEKITNFKHSNRVSSLAVSGDGFALATGCWDYSMRTYA